nr:hypothetical protein BaRGS_004268 [Batillaria attramentaria]
MDEDQPEVDSEESDELPVPALEEGPADVSLNPDLSQEQRRDVLQVCEGHAACLADLPGRTNLEEFSITRGDSRPVFLRPRPIPYSQVDVVKWKWRPFLKSQASRRSLWQGGV